MLGLCCQWMEAVPGKNPKNAFGEKALQLGKFNTGSYTQSQIKDVWIGNIRGIRKKLPDVKAAGIRMIRIGSSLLPLFDKIWHDEKYAFLRDETIDELKKLGNDLAGFRVTMHPGQFVVLNSESDSVVANSVADLAYHAFVMDTMGLESSHQNPINVHGGRKGYHDKLIATISALPTNIRNRLVLENCESSWSVKELYKIYEAVGTPVTFDSHHHTFNEDGLTGEEAANKAASTWKCVPLQHLSNTTPGMEGGSFTERRQHSYLMHYIPNYQKAMYVAGKCDIEMECKGKNLGFLEFAKKEGIKI